MGASPITRDTTDPQVWVVAYIETVQDWPWLRDDVDGLASWIASAIEAGRRNPHTGPRSVDELLNAFADVDRRNHG